jgi:hypothetical protein
MAIFNDLFEEFKDHLIADRQGGVMSQKTLITMIYLCMHAYVHECFVIQCAADDTLALLRKSFSFIFFIVDYLVN